LSIQLQPPWHQTDLTKTEPLHSILSLKQLAQRKTKTTEGYKRENTNYIKM
jgi:hypothetical protein